MNKLLVIDDDPCVLWAVVLALRKAGFEVAGCCSGAEAIQAARTIRPELVLCDVVMPDMNGYEVLGAMRQITGLSDLPFIFLTGKETVQDMRAGMERGADDYLPKSLSITEVIRAVTTRIERHRAMREANAVGPGAAPPNIDQMQKLGLSLREAEVMHWVIEGKTNEEIGLILGISRATVRTHLQNIFPKLGVENRQAAAQAVRRGRTQAEPPPGKPGQGPRSGDARRA